MSNQAAWYTKKFAKPFEVAEAPYPTPSPTEVVVKNQAVAINPVDWKVQNGSIDFVKVFPFVIGEDVAGIVETVGSEVKHVKKGDKVIGNTHSLLSGEAKHGGFQQYSTVASGVVAKIPEELNFDSASVLPLAISTAASALYQPDHLGLPLPSISPVLTDKILVLWGGSSSIGAVSIQLAQASGITVITTASHRNHSLVKSLGAEEVFDYNSSSVVADIITAIKASEKTFVGILDCISAPESLEMCYSILRQSSTTNKIVSLHPKGQVPEDVDFSFAVSFTIVGDEHKHIREAVWGDYVPKALADGSLKAAPEPLVVGKGLESIQHALAVQEKGVSAKKIVVEL